ncbi:gastrula zinc finger protein XlCGF7.1-like [Trichogramma pretiosum]|uniref:gastrula zinc finger protein XlCGF7.1-like n=1 Tax=Trichogramma pretiosum TaxID=7493 RepID=UPI0006C99DEB|nr:gastrula zinc finger protein XlCGF7.1-like [Trichogramma pretiosum]
MDSTKCNNNKPTTYYCCACEARYEEHAAFQRHLLDAEAHPRLRRRYVCDLCPSAYATKSGLRQHRVARHEAPHQCRICPKRYGKPSQLAQHLAAVHLGRRQFRCGECGRGFAREDNLRQHRAVLHQGLKRFLCDRCPEAFGLKVTLKLHVARVHDARRLECAECGKLFSKFNHVKRHLHTVHLKLKPYRCELCDRPFGRKEYLKAHTANVHKS